MDLIKALEFIHANNIVHMDVKPANIIVTNNSICKLTDFGCSIRINKSKVFNLENGFESLNEYEDNRWTAGTWYLLFCFVIIVIIYDILKILI